VSLRCFENQYHIFERTHTRRLKLQIFGQFFGGRSWWSDARMPAQWCSRDRTPSSSIYAHTSNLPVLKTWEIDTSATTDGRRIVGQPSTWTRPGGSEIFRVIIIMNAHIHIYINVPSLDLWPCNAIRIISYIFYRPVLIEVPNFGSLRGSEREIVVLRSDNGETWREHTVEVTDEVVKDILGANFDKEGTYL